jgi:hypothetical protein
MALLLVCMLPTTAYARSTSWNTSTSKGLSPKVATRRFLALRALALWVSACFQ